MILPSFLLRFTANQKFKESGIDSLEFCIDSAHWLSYPYAVEYNYNSRGYRDAEWPEDLDNVIWCFGDSFTAGIGVPFSHTWPQILSRLTERRTINVSIDGASNNWIARKLQELSREIQPQTVIIQWSFAHRREAQGDGEVTKVINFAWQRLYESFRDDTWPDCERLIDFDLLPNYIQKEILEQHCFESDRLFIESRHQTCSALMDEGRRVYYSDLGRDVENTQQCIQSSHDCLPQTKIIHSFVPDFAEPDEQLQIIQYIQQQGWLYVEPFAKQDVGRDGYHYDKVTATALCDQLIKLI